MLVYILGSCWILLGLYIARNNFRAVRLSEASYAGSDTVPEEWRPFLRADKGELPWSVVLLFRSILIGPIFFALSCMVLVSCGISALLVSESLLRHIVRYVTYVLCYCGGITVKESGVYAKTPCIVSNHNSAFDIAILFKLIPCSFVAMDGVKAIPIVGPVARAIGCIFVVRESKDSRLATKQAIVERLQQQYADKKSSAPPLAVFPEGSTTNGKYLLQFRRGAFEANVPVQPVWIEFSDHLLHYTVFNLAELWSLACSVPAREVCVHWLPVVAPGSAESMADAARNAIAQCKSAFGHPRLIKHDTGSHREAIAVSNFFRNRIYQ